MIGINENQRLKKELLEIRELLDGYGLKVKEGVIFKTDNQGLFYCPEIKTPLDDKKNKEIEEAIKEIIQGKKWGKQKISVKVNFIKEPD